jgi:hypothetical protein
MAESGEGGEAAQGAEQPPHPLAGRPRDAELDTADEAGRVASVPGEPRGPDVVGVDDDARASVRTSSAVGRYVRRCRARLEKVRYGSGSG